VEWYDATNTAVAVEQLRATFREAFGGTPDGMWAAPGRVNLIGEHVDYNAGRCLPIALPHRTFCAVRRRTDGVLDVHSGQGYPPWSGPVTDLDPSGVVDWARYVAGAVWALGRAGAAVSGLDVAVASDVPIGAGLSSSAALICATALAAAELSGWDDRDALTKLCVDAETRFVGAPTGGMDQAAALRTRAGHALLLDCRDDHIDHVVFDVAGAERALLVIDTRVSHSNVDGRYGERRSGCERAARLLGVCSLRDVADATAGTDPHAVDDTLRPLAGDESAPLARHVVTEMHRVDAAAAELLAGHIDNLGPLLDASHRSLRDDFRVSCPELDLAVEASVAAGAIGARMTGGGFGGSAIALLPASAVTTVASAVDEAFTAAGFRRPRFLRAIAAGPGGRIA
jgi:galactokinase